MSSALSPERMRVWMSRGDRLIWVAPRGGADLVLDWFEPEVFSPLAFGGFPPSGTSTAAETRSSSGNASRRPSSSASTSA